MIVNLPQTYLIGLCLLLVIIAILVGRQLYKVRKDEMQLIKLEKEDSNTKEDSSKNFLVLYLGKIIESFLFWIDIRFSTANLYSSLLFD